MQTIEPASTQVVIKAAEKTNKTKSGLLLPESRDVLPPNIADVVSVGKGVEDYKTGDTVVFKQFTATPVELDGTDFALIHHEDLMGTIVGTK